MKENLLTINASTVNGEYKETPEVVTLRCGEVFPVGIMDVIDPSFNGCISKRKVFVVRQGEDLFGTFDFADAEELQDYLDINCCVDCTEDAVFTFRALELFSANVVDVYTGRNSRRATLAATAQWSNSFTTSVSYIIRKKYVRIEAFTDSTKTTPRAFDVIQEQLQGTLPWVNKVDTWTMVSNGVAEKLFTVTELPNIRIFG